MSSETLPNATSGPAPLTDGQIEYRSLSQWKLIWIGFKKHKFAMISLYVVALFYSAALLCQFLAPYATTDKLDIPYAPPVRVRIADAEGRLHAPFVYGLTKSRDPETFQAIYVTDTTARYPVRFFVRASEYKLFGLFVTNVHLFGVDEPGKIALFGTDNNGRDVFSRTVIATRISTSIGLIAIALSLFLGLIIGAASAYFGGWVDLSIQKVIEVLISVPTIPLWMGLSAALPRHWSPLLVYFAVTIILALRGWIGVARVVRGKFLSIREEDYIMASKNFGAGSWYIMVRHMIPNFMSYVIVSITLSVPWMIIGETSLSYLGIGLRPPVVSWGVLLKSAQNIHSIVEYTWTLIPALFVIIIVLAFNFVGDGLRDAADPYGRR